MFQALFQLGLVVGPAIAGLLLAGVGVRFIYWIDAACLVAAVVAAFLMRPQRPQGTSHPPGLRSIAAGFGYLRGRQVLQGAYLLDINAMVFGMPRALFPALAATVFGGGARTLGLLYAAPGAGALLGALTTGWVPGSAGRAARSSSRSSSGGRRSPASGWCTGCPRRSRCWPSPGSPTSSRRCSATRSSSFPCLMRCAGA